MKTLSNPITRIIPIAVAAVLCAVSTVRVSAAPYASGITNDSGTIRFVMNEAGADVNVVFEDTTTLAMGVLPKGATNFLLGAHVGFKIICTKIGNGVPSLISSDAYTNSVWGSPRGVAVNQNAKNGRLFGRIYAGSSAASGTFGTTLKQKGLYALNADQTDALGTGTNAFGASGFGTGDGTGFAGSGPWRLRVAPDDSVVVADSSVIGNAVYQYSPNLNSSNLVLAGIGRTAGVAAGTHGGLFGTPLITGSIAGGDMVLWTADANLSAPGTATLGPGTSPGSFNCIYRFNIGSGPLPWTGAPNYAYTMGLDGIPGLRAEMTLGVDGKIIAGFGRANLSNPNIQILDPTGATVLYTSWLTTGGASDPWNGVNGSGSAIGTYGGVRVSPDGRFLASVDINNGITIANLTNGIPDDGSIVGISNLVAVGNSRGMDWDAAGNLYVISSGQGLLRIYTLGLTTTCVTSNDFTGTNGTFTLELPPLSASVVATTPQASQNFGTPISGVFRITLNTNSLSSPLTVNFTRSGTAAYTNHYSINTNELPNGVTVGVNSVTFPAGIFAGSNGPNWNVDVKITPTPSPVSTNTLTVVLQVLGGSGNLAGAPAKGTVFIQNTGPQLLLLAAAPVAPAAGGTSATMYRGVTNDYSKFVITRLGDTNAALYTITNITYAGTASFPLDYGARAQRLDPAGNGILVPPVDGPTSIIINPGDTLITCAVGNPESHLDLSAIRSNLTIVVNLTNTTSPFTNGTSAENTPYSVGTNTTTLTIIDNAVGPEVVLWSNPLTNAADSVNWTLTYAATNFAANTVLPAVFPNYNNSNYGGGTNDFEVTFGSDSVANGVPLSPVMIASNWTTALKMTVNKANGAHAGVNLYPQGQNFGGNYALRFNMFLSIYQFASNNPSIGSPAREFATFGVNHHGTNCNWKTATVLAANAGNSPTNSDGQWMVIGAGTGSITPADFESFVPPAVPNAGVGPKVSNAALTQNGVFKHPPFEAMNVTTPTVANPGGGSAVNKWVDVSVEVNRQTNINVFINGSLVIPTFALTNGSLATTFTNGNIMLGYLDPNADLSDSSAFVYYSNVRVVEISPYIVTQPGLAGSGADRLIVTQGSSLTLTSAVAFASNPITNVWYRGTGTAANPGTGVPTFALQTNTAAATSMTDSLTLNNLQAIGATNYMSVFSDAAGSVTSRVVAVEVVLGPTNRIANAGSTLQFPVNFVGPIAPALFQWRTNGVNLANTAGRFGGVTTSNLFITNVLASDALVTYSVLVSNVAGTVTPTGLLSVVSPVTPASQTNLWGSTANLTVPTSGSVSLTYQWKRAGTNLSNGGIVSGATSSTLTLTGVTRADATNNYTVGVTNGVSGVLGTSGSLTVIVPPPGFTNAVVSGGIVTLSFSTTNTFDTTSAFILQSAGDVTGPYTNTPATFTGSAGSFQVTAPQTGDKMFYRLLHVN